MRLTLKCREVSAGGVWHVTIGAAKANISFSFCSQFPEVFELPVKVTKCAIKISSVNRKGYKPLYLRGALDVFEISRQATSAMVAIVRFHDGVRLLECFKKQGCLAVAFYYKVVLPVKPITVTLPPLVNTLAGYVSETGGFTFCSVLRGFFDIPESAHYVYLSVSTQRTKEHNKPFYLAYCNKLHIFATLQPKVSENRLVRLPTRSKICAPLLSFLKKHKGDLVKVYAHVSV